MRRLSLALVFASSVVACSEEPEHTHDAGTGVDAGPEPESDAGPPLECILNADCPDEQRCGCTEEDGCFCEPGARGTGRNGVDPCVDGNDCETSLCFEGNGDFTCSGPCVDDTDCREGLPICADIAFVGRVCIRDPNG